MEIYTWKDAEQDQLLEKLTSKPQDSTPHPVRMGELKKMKTWKY